MNNNGKNGKERKKLNIKFFHPMISKNRNSMKPIFPIFRIISVFSVVLHTTPIPF